MQNALSARSARLPSGTSATSRWERRCSVKRVQRMQCKHNLLVPHRGWPPTWQNLQGDPRDLQQHQGSHRGLEMVWEGNHKCLGIGAESWRQMEQGLPPMLKNSPNSSCSSWLGGSNDIFYLSFTWQHNFVQEMKIFHATKHCLWPDFLEQGQLFYSSLHLPAQ